MCLRRYQPVDSPWPVAGNWCRQENAGSIDRERRTVLSRVVSSLWTPDGEHRVEREASGSSGAGARSEPPAPDNLDDLSEELSPEAEAELDQIRAQLLDAPAEVVIGNHAYGMFELAALHLSANPPNLAKARLAVDALGALVDALEGRLGEVEAPLKDALAQIRLAYVQIGAAAGENQPSELPNRR